MDKAYRRWSAWVLAGLAAVLLLCALAVYIVDPCLYYRIPDRWQPIFFNERYQNAGLVRHVPADTVLLGSSMVANFRASQVEAAYGGTALRITIPDGYYSEYDQAVDALFRAQSPQRVVFAVDLNILTRDESGKTEAMPAYLYNANPLDDIQYLLNKDSLYYSAYTLLANRWGEGQSVDDAFTWDKGTWWNHMATLEEYIRPDIAAETLPSDALLADTQANLQVLEGWIAEHPDTEFVLYFSPYSILYWDKTIRTGQLDAVFAAMEYSCAALLAHGNVQLHAPLLDREIVEDLDRYCDYVHHSGETAGLVLEKLADGEDRLTADNYRQTLAQWRTFVEQYDFEKFWDEDYWLAQIAS